MGGLLILVDGLDCSAVTVKGIRATRSIGSTSGLSLTVHDLDMVMPARVPKLAELVVGPMAWGRYASGPMRLGRYELANTLTGTGLATAVTIRHRSFGATDTLGIIRLVGTDGNGDPLTEDVTPAVDDVVTSAGLFATLDTATGIGWAAAEDPDIVTIGHTGPNLFRGQVTNAKRKGLNTGTGRAIRHTITAEGWQRLLPKSHVAPLLDWPRTVTSDNESSLINEQAWDTSVEGWGMSDGEVIKALLADVGSGGFWEGPTLDLSDVESFITPDATTGLTFDPPLRFSNIGIDAAITQIQSRLPADGIPLNTVFWIDDQCAAHYKVLELGEFVDYGDLTMGRPELAALAPYKLGTYEHTDVDGLRVILPISVEDGEEHGSIVRTVQVSGTTPWSVLTLSDGPSHAGRESISSSAVTSGDAMKVGWWAMKDRLNPRISGTARIAAWFDGWDLGQMLAITHDDLYPTETWFPIRAISAELVSPGDPDPAVEYTLTFGDAERRSYVSESEDNYKGETVADRAVRVRVSTYDPAPSVGSYQLLDGQPIASTGQPMMLPGRTIQWVLFVNGTDVGVGDEATIGWWLSGTWDGTPGDPGNTMINPDSGLAYCALNRGSASLPTDYCDVRAELLDAT